MKSKTEKKMNSKKALRLIQRDIENRLFDSLNLYNQQTSGTQNLQNLQFLNGEAMGLEKALIIVKDRAAKSIHRSGKGHHTLSEILKGEGEINNLIEDHQVMLKRRKE